MSQYRPIVYTDRAYPDVDCVVCPVCALAIWEQQASVILYQGTRLALAHKGCVKITEAAS
jgi:hypothetical protein